MDKDTAKEILACYRPAEAADPIFAEALEEVAKDEDLANWLKEEQRFDAVMTAKLGQFASPSSLRDQILAGKRPSTPDKRPWYTQWTPILAMAAVLTVAAATFWQEYGPVRPSQRLALQAIHFTEQMPALEFVCFNAGEVANWVNVRAEARSLGFVLPEPAASFSMKMIGSSIVDWEGRPVVMICLQNGSRMGMLYIMDAKGAPETDSDGEVLERDGWAVRTSRAGEKVHVLTTKGTKADLDFQMPF